MNLKKVFKNAGILAGGDVIAALLVLISFSILARSLGVNTLGLFSVIITFVTLVDKFFNFFDCVVSVEPRHMTASTKSTTYCGRKSY